MLVDTNRPGQWLDVNPATASSNGMLANMINAGSIPGNTTGDVPTSNHSASGLNVALLGTWYKVPDSSVSSTRGIVSDTIVWHLPNGSTIILDDSEINGRITLGSMFSWSGSFTNVSIKYTANTYPGLVAFGIIPASTPPPPNPNPNPGSGNGNPNTPAAVISASRSIMIIALIGAAIYFIPKNIIKFQG